MTLEPKASPSISGGRPGAGTILGRVCDLDLLYRAFCSVASTRGATTAGLDGVLPSHLAERGLGTYLGQLSDDLCCGRYNPSLARRHRIERDGKVRSVDVNTTRDRIVGCACALVISEEMEAIGPSCSYAERGRGADALLDDLTQAIAATRGSDAYLVAIDIRNFYPSVPHFHLGAQLAHIFGDSRFCRLVLKLVRTKVKTLDGSIIRPEQGIALGSSLAPALANMFLHSVDVALSGDASDLRLGFHGRYADNFFFLVRGDEAQVRVVLERLEAELGALGLSSSAPEGGPLTDGAPVLGFHLSRPGRMAWAAKVSARTRDRLGRRLAEVLRTKPHHVDEYCTGWLRHFGPAEDCAVVLNDELSRLGLCPWTSPQVTGPSGPVGSARPPTSTANTEEDPP